MAKYTALSKQDDEQYEMPVEEAIELARGHHMTGNFILAERTYHDVLRAVPDNPTANHLLGALYYQVGNMDKAFHYMKISTELAPDEKQYWSNYGSAFYMEQRHDEAIECFDKALECDPAHVESMNRKALALWQKEEYEKAEGVARHSLEMAPDNLDGLINLGLALARQEKFEEADELWKRAGEIYPQDGRIWSNWSNMLREMYLFGRAEKAARKAIELAPEDTDALNNLGCILKDLGRNEEAVDIFRQATNIRPKIYEAHYNMALALHELGRYEEAAIAARYAIDFKPDYGDAYNALSSAQLEAGEFTQAHYAAQRAVQLNPDQAEAYLNLADVLYLSNSFDDGHAALKEALKRDPDNPRAYAKLAGIYERLDEVDDALWAIDKAIELAPHVAAFLSKKASILHISNEIEGALEAVDQALEKNPKLMPALITKAEIFIAVNKPDEAREVLARAKEVDPDHPLIYFTMSNIKKFESEDDPDLQVMLGLAEKIEAMGTVYKSSLYYALAKAYENLKQYEKAFEYLDIANQEKRKTLPYNEAKQPAFFERMKAEYSPAMIKQLSGKGFKTDVPVFIIGMPRSGTTLTEQIISSHPDVFGAGELPDVMRIKRRIGEISPSTIEEAGKIYMELVSARDKTGTAKRITDKMPGNYMNIGFILSMLPEAKVIHCRRNALDTCLSNYRQNFMVGQYWSYDLEELGAEYLRYLDLMAYWHEQFPDRILDVDYEETVSNLEGQARKLIDYVGLEWDEACLEPHKQKRAVLTASKAQVTKPVYQSSVQKWKRYESQLQPLIEVLSAGGLKV
ncbi:MAG: tetratricopeptide repeat protein [Alphaproteobacteria bacterium]|nr:tetratricopeptide repeat protein [Alphaproteobacteria bacterium]